MKKVRLSIYGKISLVLGVSLLITALAIAISAGIMTSKMATELSENLIMNKLKGDLNSIKERAKLNFSILTYNEMSKTLIDISGQDVAQNTKFVDEIQKDLGIAATIFVKDGDDFRRITTNIKKKDGTRAVGTFLGKDSAAYKPVTEGKTYYGPTKVLGEPYYTAYEPIIDQGRVIGILFVGFKKSDLLAYLFNFKVRSYTILAVVTLALLIITGILGRILVGKSIVRPSLEATDNINSASQQVGSAAHQVASASANIAEGTQRQAAAVDQVDSLISSIMDTARRNEDTARETSSIAEQTRESLKRVEETIKRMEEAMRNIDAASEKTIRIIKNIDEISFQTNILALNAAVEAARAGEAGAGFAVVADEVRNLAMRSAEAAKNSRELIESTVGAVKEGESLADKLSKLFAESLSTTDKVMTMVNEVSLASREQSESVRQVKQALQEVVKVTEATASGAEELSSTADELASQAAHMVEVIDGYVRFIRGGGAKNDKAGETEQELKNNVRPFPVIEEEVAAIGYKRRRDTMPSASQKLLRVVPYNPQWELVQDNHEHYALSCLERGFYEEAYRAYLRAREQKTQGKDFQAAARLGIHVGGALLAAYKWVLAKRALETTLLDAEAAQDNEIISQTCRSLGVFHLATGDTETARKYFAHGIRAAEAGQIKGEEDALHVFLDMLGRMEVC